MFKNSFICVQIYLARERKSFRSGNNSTTIKRKLDNNCTDDILAVAGLAGVGHDEELHDDVVDVGGRRLENVDVLSAHTLLYVHHCLPDTHKK